MSIPGRISSSLSDNQAYPQVCIQAANDYAVFNEFRRNPVYTTILEHVTAQVGAEYLQIISQDPEILSAVDNFKENDKYGNPVICDYPGVGTVSPTTLRYVKVLADLKAYFRTLDAMDICEIGVGYGGQCRVINAYYKPSTYCLIDIQPALVLAQRFLDNYALHSTLSYKTMNELPRNHYDLFVSNYAFTELHRAIQDVYLDKVILRSRRGYITYNDITPPDFRSYKSDELVRMIPGARIVKEEPLTHPRNCIILWGDNA